MFLVLSWLLLLCIQFVLVILPTSFSPRFFLMYLINKDETEHTGQARHTHTHTHTHTHRHTDTYARIHTHTLSHTHQHTHPHTHTLRQHPHPTPTPHTHTHTHPHTPYHPRHPPPHPHTHTHTHTHTPPNIPSLLNTNPLVSQPQPQSLLSPAHISFSQHLLTIPLMLSLSFCLSLFKASLC